MRIATHSMVSFFEMMVSDEYGHSYVARRIKFGIKPNLSLTKSIVLYGV